MNLQGKIKNISFDLEGKPILSLEIGRMADVNQLTSLKVDEEVKIKINKKNASRTLEQNNLMWAIISEIDLAINAMPTEDGRWDIYTQGIENLGVEYEDLYIPKTALSMFKKAYRVCRVINELENRLLIRCYIGSSKFTKKQMIELIEYFLRYASEAGVTIIDYRSKMEELFWKNANCVEDTNN